MHQHVKQAEKLSIYHDWDCSQNISTSMRKHRYVYINSVNTPDITGRGFMMNPVLPTAAGKCDAPTPTTVKTKQHTFSDTTVNILSSSFSTLEFLERANYTSLA